MKLSDQSGEQNLKLKINTETPTLNEIKMALKQTKMEEHQVLII
jgi:hypothetical protein